MGVPDLEALCPCTEQDAYIKPRHDDMHMTRRVRHGADCTCAACEYMGKVDACLSNSMTER